MNMVNRAAVIVGATGPEIVKLIDSINTTSQFCYQIEGFLDDNPDKWGTSFMGYPVLGSTTLLSGPYKNCWVVNNVGSATAARKGVWQKMKAAGAGHFPVLAHSGIDLRYVAVGEGTVIQEGCIIGPNVRIGAQCWISAGVFIGHDSSLADVICLSPRAFVGSRVTVCEGAYLGAGCIILPQCRVGEWSTVGAGSTVIEEVPDHSTVFGCPARVIARRPPAS